MTETLEVMTINEVVALALALGPTKLVVGPLAIVVVLVAAGNLLEFHTYLVLPQGKMNELVGLGEVSEEQSELYGTSIQAKSVAAALVVFLLSLRVRPLCGPSGSA